jgi:RND family efflux transporter MFP subunit
MRTPRRSSIALATLVALPAVFAAGCARTAPAEQEAAPAVVVSQENLVVAERAVLSSGPAISGSLRADREATVRAEVPGAVLQTAVEEGQAVKKGALLVRIDDTGVRDAELSARSAVRAGEEQLAVAKRSAERAEALLRSGAVAERDTEAASSALANAQWGLEDAKARHAMARQQLAKTALRAPFDGVVSKRWVAAGDAVQPGMPVVTVVAPETMRLDASVPAERLGELKVGLPVEFSVKGYPNRTFRGTIDRINPTADPSTRQVPIYVAIPNQTGELVAGLYAEGRVASQSREGIAVPPSAIDQQGEQASVVKIVDGKAERVSVTLGLRDEESERVEVLAGVAAGDRLLVGAAKAITPGSAVELRQN